MEKWKTHLFSFLTLSVFLLLALASEPDGSLDLHCTDISLKASEPLPISGSTLASYQILVLDKETNLPIPFVEVQAVWKEYNCIALVDCPEQCFMSRGSSSDHQGETNSSGLYENTAPSWEAKDEKDRMIGEITIIDESSQYVTKRITVQITNGQSSASSTVHLLKNSSL